MEGFGEIGLDQLTEMVSNWLVEQSGHKLTSSPKAYAEAINSYCNGQITLTGFCCHLLSQEGVKNAQVSADDFASFLKINLCDLVVQQPYFKSRMQELDDRPSEAETLKNVSATTQALHRSYQQHIFTCKDS